MNLSIFRIKTIVNFYKKTNYMDKTRYGIAPGKFCTLSKIQHEKSQIPVR